MIQQSNLGEHARTFILSNPGKKVVVVGWAETAFRISSSTCTVGVSMDVEAWGFGGGPIASFWRCSR